MVPIKLKSERRATLRCGSRDYLYSLLQGCITHDYFLCCDLYNGYSVYSEFGVLTSAFQFIKRRLKLIVRSLIFVAMVVAQTYSFSNTNSGVNIDHWLIQNLNCVNLGNRSIHDATEVSHLPDRTNFSELDKLPQESLGEGRQQIAAVTKYTVTSNYIQLIVGSKVVSLSIHHTTTHFRGATCRGPDLELLIALKSRS